LHRSTAAHLGPSAAVRYAALIAPWSLALSFAPDRSAADAWCSRLLQTTAQCREHRL